MNEKDPTSELREKLLSLTYRCPKGNYTPRCPFSMLNGLSDTSRRVVFARMSYTEMSTLFDLLPECACPADPRRAAENGDASTGGA